MEELKLLLLVDQPRLAKLSNHPNNRLWIFEINVVKLGIGSSKSVRILWMRSGKGVCCKVVKGNIAEREHVNSAVEISVSFLRVANSKIHGPIIRTAYLNRDD